MGRGKRATDSEKKEEESKRKTAAADYKTDEHMVDIDVLYKKIADEFEAQCKTYHAGSWDGKPYDPALGVTEHQRTAMSEGGEKLNRLTPKAQVPEWVKFLKELSGFFSLLLWAGSALCFIGYALKQDLDNLYLGIVLAAVVLITGIFSYYQDSKSASLMAQFANMMAPSVDVRVQAPDGSSELAKIDAVRLVRGDIVKLKSGEKVPADIRVIECNELKVNNSPLTGEPDALERSLDYGTDPRPEEAKNLCFFGTNIENGAGMGIVIFIADDTFIGRVAALTEATDNVQTPINKEIHHFIKIVSSVAMFLGITFFLIGVGLDTDPITNLVFMIGIIVANVPEGLLATVTVCLTLTSKTMAEKMVLVKNMEGVETLGSTTCICSDKTGTLTQNVMTFANLVYNNKTFKSPFVEDPTTPAVDREDATFKEFLKSMKLNTTAYFKPEDMRSKELFKEVSSFGNIVPVVQWGTEGDASESSIIKFAQFMSFAGDDEGQQQAFDCNTDLMLKAREQFSEVASIPFNSTNKYHVMVVASEEEADADFRHTVYMKGAPDRILNRCNQIIMDGEVTEFSPERRAELNQRMVELMEKGRRVLGFAMRRLPTADYPVGFEFDAKANLNFPMGEGWEIAEGETEPRFVGEDESAAKSQQLVFIGLAALIDPPRPAVPAAVIDCQTAGIRVVMVTGDHPKTAKAIAQMVNIIAKDSYTEEEIAFRNNKNNLKKGDEGWEDPNLGKAVVVPGKTISPFTAEEKWKYIFAHDEIVFARTSPAQKLMIVQKFQLYEKEIVAVTGDGVNDAPALKAADIGVAMGIAGTEVSKSAADMILLDDNFASIVAGVEEGRLIFDNLKKSIAYTLSSNIPEIAPFLVFITVGTPLPLSTVLILCIDLGTDMVPAISMAWENAENDIMKRPARDAQVDRLVTSKLVSFSYLQIGTFQAIGGFFTWMVVLNDYGYPPHVLVGLGTFDNWGKQVLYCKLVGGVFRNVDGVAAEIAGNTPLNSVQNGYHFWDPSTDGTVEACDFAAKSFVSTAAEPSGFDIITTYDYTAATVDAAGSQFSGETEVVTKQAIEGLFNNGYVPYMPWKAYNSPFFQSKWLSWDVKETGVPGAGPSVNPTLIFGAQLPGVWDIQGTDAQADEVLANDVAKDAFASVFGSKNLASTAKFIQPRAVGSDSASFDAQVTANNAIASQFGFSTWADGTIKTNVASRMMQKEALHHAQCAYFVSIVVVQWADLMICKTRWLSITEQGMVNPAMNFGLVFETILAAWICYLPAFNDALGTRPIRFLHWAAAVPFSMVIFIYDEVRKAIMRNTSPAKQVGKQIIREYGWLARQTYY